MPHIHLRVLFAKNRNLTGWLRVEKNGRPLAEFAALGRGSRGSGETSLLKDGNTPVGDYDGTRIESTSTRNPSSYGPWGAVRLKPLGGNAILAERLGRAGLLIHGGNLGTSNYWRGADALRATHGCIRLNNEDMRRLRQILEEASLGENACIAPTVTVSVEES